MSIKRVGTITLASGIMILAAIALAVLLRQDYEMKFDVGQEEYTVNGTTKQFEAGKDNPPFIDQSTGRLLLPLRWTMEEMGGTVTWDKDTNATVVSYKNKTVKVFAESNKASVNGYSIILDYIPTNKNGCLYVDSAFISDNFATDITWNEQNNQVLLKTEVITKPVVNKNTIDFSELTLAYTIDVPVITGLNDTKFEQELNNTFLKEKMDEITKFSLEAQNTFEQTHLKSFWHLKNTVSYRSQELISIFSEGAIRKGGQEKENLKAAVTIDLQTQKILKLNDFFKDGTYKKVLIDKINDIIRANDLGNTIVYTEELETQFYIVEDKKDIVLFFQDKNIGDFLEYGIPLEEISNLLKTDYKYLVKK